MPIQKNESQVWDQIWENIVPENVDYPKLIGQTKETKSWKIFNEIVMERFGGWKDLRCIELGAGLGGHSLAAASEGADVTLMDYSDNAIHHAKKRFATAGLSAKFINDDAFNEREEKGSYDLSWSFGTAEHFRDPLRQRFFDLHFEYVKSAGITIISVPNALAINYRIWMFIAKKFDEWSYGLEIPYSKSEFLRRSKVKNRSALRIIYETGRPCLKKSLKILRRNNKLLYIFLYPILYPFIKASFDIGRFSNRSVIYIGCPSNQDTAIR